MVMYVLINDIGMSTLGQSVFVRLLSCHAVPYHTMPCQNLKIVFNVTRCASRPPYMSATKRHACLKMTTTKRYFPQFPCEQQISSGSVYDTFHS